MSGKEKMLPPRIKIAATLLSAAMLHEKLTRPAVLGMVVACAGIVLMGL